ncbi:hypothetical protein CCM_09037 [Cordyceps militaris CM01]|uniref:Apple domain-containing protein n=1 Tax=Cordyceps militaris (strain CM01) TaxID=983644 RepID=G3JSZ4_CORMM|nr:uncharacterized protein CCM_09037 [Cordyceps militaris CM01]EGX88990.1 hypothetical protein CCM_09037 [Cordyceps militaris CM01]
MQLPNSAVKLLSLAILVVPAVAALDCVNEVDHKKEYTTNGKVYKLYCNSEIKPITPSERIDNVATPEECANRCAQKSDCRHAYYPANNGRTFELLCGYANPSLGYQTIPNVNSLRACAEKCALDSKCANAEYHITTGDCIPSPARATLGPFSDLDSVSFETTGVNNCKFYGPGDYSTVHKPGVHHHYATSPPTSAPDHFGSKRCSTACPEADGQIFASPTGENFVMSCKKRHGTTYLKDVPDRYPSFASCMTACGAVPACQSVDYEAKTNNCYFSTNSKSPTIAAKAFMSAHSAGCSGACAGCADDSCKDLEKGPLGPRKYGCPANHGKPITVNGVDFQVACQHAINSHPYTQVTAESYEKCIELCAANANCGGVNWIGKTCYHHPDNNADESSAFVHQRADSDAYVKIPGHLYSSLSQAS